MRIRHAVVLALVLALTACGGDATPDAKSTPKATSTPAKKVALDGSLPQVAEGQPVPDALREFVCTRNEKKGTWRATGAVVNDTKKPATFQVTAHVGPADGQGAAARTKRIASVQAHGSVRFDLGAIESRSPDGPCHVQVLAL
jgi:hypothetical protein